MMLVANRTSENRQWLSNPDNKGLPPVLDGQTFQLVGYPNRFNLNPFFELYMWAWRDNPNGAFVDWNNKVHLREPVMR